MAIQLLGVYIDNGRIYPNFSMYDRTNSSIPLASVANKNIGQAKEISCLSVKPCLIMLQVLVIFSPPSLLISYYLLDRFCEL